MYSFLDQISAEIKDIGFLIKQCRKRMKNDFEGRLEKKTVNGNVYYYRRYFVDGIKHSTYLGKAEDEAVGLFIQQKVLQKQIETLQEDLALLEEMKDKYVDYSEESALAELGKSYKVDEWPVDMLMELQMAEDDKITDIWKKRHLSNHSRRRIDRPTVTSDGKKVRSKGECIIYDYLIEEDIFFDYEGTIYLIDKDGKMQKMNPDFIIKISKDDNLIIEHLGYLDDPDYVKQVAWKLSIYHMNGYDLGHNLFFTSDDKNHAIDGEYIRDMIKGIIKKRVRSYMRTS